MPHGERLVLWDCITLIDDETVERVKRAGDLEAIAISHPHYYSCMVEWAHALDCPVYLHTADAEWIIRPDPAIELWDGETKELAHGLTLVRCGGHFAGGTVLHWPAARTTTARCSPATSSWSSRTGRTSRSCTAIRT